MLITQGKEEYFTNVLIRQYLLKKTDFIHFIQNFYHIKVFFKEFAKESAV